MGNSNDRIETMSLYQRLLLLPVLALALVSCAGHRMYINEEADFGYYEKIGVLPFSNLSSDRTASEKVTSSFLTEILVGSRVEIANMGDLLKVYRDVVKDERFNLPEQLSAEETQAIGKVANLQGLLVGTVRDYGMIRSGQTDFPLVSILVRFLDCKSGKVVWSYEITRKGGPKFPVFSFGETHTLGDMTAKVCREAAAAFLGTLK
jgi:hypothetical protein